MSVNKRIHVCFYLFVFIFYFSGNIFASGFDDDLVVVTVDGGSIFYKEIKVKEDLAKRIFKANYSHPPQSKKDFIKLKEIVRNSEIKNLVSSIQHIVHNNQVIKKYKIVVSSKERKEKWKDLTQDMDIKKKLVEGRKMYAPVFQAWDAVNGKGIKSEEAFNLYLKNSVVIRSKSDWEIFLKTSSPESIASLKKLVNQTVKDARTPDPGVTDGLVLKEKLEIIIDKELAKKDPEFAEFIALRAKFDRFKNKHEKPKESKKFGLDYLNQKRNLWWRDRYKEADIKIFVPEFEPALEILIGKPKK